MGFLEEAEARGFIHQCTDKEELSNVMANPISAYIGFDCTADSLHVGSLMQIMMLRLLQKHGHQSIVVIGGATTRIGDPSGKDASRKMLQEHEIIANMQGIRNCLSPFLKWQARPMFVGMDYDTGQAMMVNNADWFQINYLDFLREVGPHFSVNRMLTMDSVKTRLEKEDHMTFLEFNYMILQSYDFVQLNRHYNVVLQIGGSDQWGNITSGIELVRRLDKKQVFGLTTPLIETASGQKMGKSEGNAIWLDKNKTSIYDYWQFWRNTDDKDVIKFLRLFTDLSLYHINCLDTGDINVAKIALATEATALVHGRDAADRVAKEAANIFKGDSVQSDDNTIEMKAGVLIDMTVSKLFVIVGLTESNSAAKRLIKGKGAKINNAVILHEDRIISEMDIQYNIIKLSSGQKNHKFIKIVH